MNQSRLNPSRFFQSATIIFLTAILMGCGGGGGDGTTSGGGVSTATGIFKDSNVSGLNYVSGSQSGVTGADGTFTYEVGQSVTFSVGGVTIGSVTGQSIVTPVDLVAGGSSSSMQVQNIVRFLMMLDVDGDASNGIVISSAVQTMAVNWSQVDFSTTDLSTALTSIISDATSVDGVTHTLPSSTVAKSHMESTLLCVYAGAFRGTYSGGDSGSFGYLLDATTGLVAGVAFSNNAQAIIALTGSTAIGFNQSPA